MVVLEGVAIIQVSRNTNILRKEGKTSMKKRISLAAIIVIALVLTITTYAFAAANTMPASTNAGDGSTSISGYTIAAVTYTLDTTDPSKIKTVTFTVTPIGSGAAATSASVQLVSAGSWFSCTLASGTATCNVAGAVSALNATTLHVVAAQ
jgi:hypothetical protein